MTASKCPVCACELMVGRFRRSRRGWHPVLVGARTAMNQGTRRSLRSG